MHYEIIKDEKAFREFIEWLPDLADGEQFYYALFGRSKYDSTNTVKSDKAQIARGTSTKERLFDKIAKLEVKLGTYKFGDVPVPQEALALYVHPNPRSIKKASINTAKAILDNIGKDRYQNPKSIALNAIQTAKSRTVFVDFDVDNKQDFNEPNLGYSDYGVYLKDWVHDTLGNDKCFRILETHGGYHILVEPPKVDSRIKNWHQLISKNPYIDQSGDLLMPVSGCTQGNHIPKFI